MRLRSAGVLIEPGYAFFVKMPEHCHFFRMRYSSIAEGEIRKGVAAMSEVLALCRQESVRQLRSPSSPTDLPWILGRAKNGTLLALEREKILKQRRRRACANSVIDLRCMVALRMGKNPCPQRHAT